MTLSVIEFVRRQKKQPLPTLLVNFVMLSESPKTVFLTKLAAPWTEFRQIMDPEVTLLYLCDADTELCVSMHYRTIQWFIKKIGDSRTDVGEEPNRIANEIGRPQYPIELAEHILAVVISDATLELWEC
jgi:hypothetical protein